MVRFSPEKSATLFNVGSIKIGNDGNKWIVVETSNGIKRWGKYRVISKIGSKKKSKIGSKKKSKIGSKIGSKKESKIGSKKKSKIGSKKKSKIGSKIGSKKESKIGSKKESKIGSKKKSKIGSKKKSKIGSNSFITKEEAEQQNNIYYIKHDGAKPFKVHIDNSGITIYEMKYEEKSHKTSYIKKILIKKSYLGYWYGYDPKYKIHHNSILIQVTKYTYIYISHIIELIKTPDEITDFISPMGNSGCPYPLAYSNSFVYFLAEKSYVNKKYFDLEFTVNNAESLWKKFYNDVKKINIQKINIQKIIAKIKL